MVPTVSALILVASLTAHAAEKAPLTLSWRDSKLRISADWLPGGALEVWYIEAYCRANSREADWGGHTVIPHTTEQVSRSQDGHRLNLRCKLADGVVVEHAITTGIDSVDFRVSVHNPTNTRSEAHWAQPCIRVGTFTGLGEPENPSSYAYIEKSFVFLDGELANMPTKDWATDARYTPGQVWAAPGVPRDDVNPRPLNPNVPSNGLIGCFSEDEALILATAWEPYQELFQGVITCLHSDFRMGGIQPGETKSIRGKIYLLPNDVGGAIGTIWEGLSRARLACDR